MNEDARKTGLKFGLRQLTVDQIRRVIDYDGEMVLDTWNYKDGRFCPLAVGLGLDRLYRSAPTHESVFAVMTLMGYSVHNTKGLSGEFYTTDRKADLIMAAKEVLEEKLATTAA